MLSVVLFMSSHVRLSTGGSQFVALVFLLMLLRLRVLLLARSDVQSMMFMPAIDQSRRLH